MRVVNRLNANVSEIMAASSRADLFHAQLKHLYIKKSKIWSERHQQYIYARGYQMIGVCKGDYAYNGREFLVNDMTENIGRW